MANKHKIPVVVLEKVTDLSLLLKPDSSCSQDSDSNSPFDDNIVLPRFVHSKLEVQNKDAVTPDRGENLKEIFIELDTMKESDQKTQSLEKELFSALNETQVTSSWQQENEHVVKKIDEYNKSTNSKEEACNVHPGEVVFDLKYLNGGLFLPEQLAFADLPEVKTDFDRFLQSKTFDQVKMMLSGNFILFQFENITSKDFVVTRLFQLMSINDLKIVVKCSELMLQIFSVNSNLSKNITMESSLEAFINMGLRLNSDDLISTVLGISYMSWYNQKVSHLVDGPFLSQNSFSHVQLDAYLDVIRTTFKIPNIKRTSSELSAFVTTLAYISLDVNLKSSFIFPKVSLCLVEILNRFEDDVWMAQRHVLASKLILLTPDYYNLYFIADLFSHSVRGIQLRRLFSYLVLHKLLKILLPKTPSDDVTPTMVYDLVSIKFFQSIENYRWLEIASRFLDMSVDTDNYFKYLKTFSDLSSFVKKIGSRKYIPESVDNIYMSKTKNSLDRLYLKWLNYAKEAPVSEMTVFSYFKPLDNTSNSQNS